jgi:MoaA/NifB/PqqE/SkfB family radical SAM enzyme
MDMFCPEVAFLVTNTECNRRESCSYCFYNVQPDRLLDVQLSYDVIHGLLAKLRLIGTRAVYVTGGEPLLREDIDRIVRRASDIGLQTSLLSNGTLLKTSTVESLERAGLNSLILSLPDNAVMDPRVITVAKGFRRASNSIICVLTKKNFNRASQVWREAQAIGASIFFQPVFIPAGHPLEFDLSLKHLNAFDWSYLYSELRPWARESGLESYWKFVYDFYHKRQMRLPYCYFAGSAFVIDADGKAFPCFHRRDMLCGDIGAEDFSVIMKRLGDCANELRSGKCFGEHCISLQSSIGCEPLDAIC